MEWKKFYRLWQTETGSTIPDDVLPEWCEFVESSEDTALERAINSVAEWYNNKQRNSTGFVANITLFQLRGAYYSELKSSGIPLGNCVVCGGEGHVLVNDNGRHGTEDFPAPKGIWARGISAMPCPKCASELYGANNALRERVSRNCVSPDHRSELYGE